MKCGKVWNNHLDTKKEENLRWQEDDIHVRKMNFSWWLLVIPLAGEVFQSWILLLQKEKEKK